jgi:hypothetical protein
MFLASKLFVLDLKIDLHFVSFGELLREKCTFSSNDEPSPRRTRGVSHSGFAICIKKYLKAKEELWKLKYFTMQKYNLQKIV